MKKLKTKKIPPTGYLIGKYKDIRDRYSSKQRTITIQLNAHIRYLCAILDIMPESIVQEYLDSLAYCNFNHRTKEQLNHSKKFFLSCRSEENGYSKKEIVQMLKELKLQKDSLQLSFGMGLDPSEHDVFYAGYNIVGEKWVKSWFDKHKRLNSRKISILDDV